MKHLELKNPFTLDEWRGALRNMDSAYSFREHAVTFGTEKSLRITDELKVIVDDFGDAALDAVFAVRAAVIESVWFDPLHHYMAIEFSRAKGDEYDAVRTLSFSQ